MNVILCNKYDIDSYAGSLRSPFECIVDVNIRSYACCDRHFLDYMGLMLASLAPGGSLVTTMGGLDYLIPTSLDDLRSLIPTRRIYNTGNVVVIAELERPSTWWSRFFR